MIIEGDCLEVLRGMEDASVDAVVTDPPYGIGFVYAGRKETHDTAEAYGSWMKPYYAEMLRVMKPGGFFAMWQAQLYFRHLWSWYGEDIHIYCAAKNFVQLRKTAINYGYDPVVMRYKPGSPPRRPLKPPRNVDFFVANTAAIVSNPNRIEKAHPCPRPLDAVIEILRNFVLPGGTVLDPFAGSGTTGVACIYEGFEPVLIEREAEYAEIARRRIAHAKGELEKTPATLL